MSGRKRVGRRIALFFTVIFVFFAASYIFFISNMYVKVKCITPTVENKTIYVSGLGYLKEGKRTGYYFDIPVKVDQLYVKVGDTVKAGDPLLKIDLNATQLTAKMAAAGIITKENGSLETANIIDYSKKISGDINEILKNVPEVVYAAYDCIISGISVQNGEYSNPYSPLVTMSDRSILCADITVDERDAKDLQIGQNATISGSALNGDIRATVISVAARATMASTDGTTSNKVDVKLELASPDPSLIINSLVRADIAVATVDNMLIVPYEAVVFSDNGDYVFLNQSGVAVQKTILIGRTLEDGVEVTSGISAGDRLIISAEKELTDGCGIKES